MYAVTKNQTQTNNDGFVKFDFKHILSQVVFQAKTQYANMEVEIKALSIHNFILAEHLQFQKENLHRMIGLQIKNITIKWIYSGNGREH